MKATKGIEIDHINGNRLDNRKINLRLCTRQQNTRNHSVRKNNKLGFTGVRQNRGKSYNAFIVIDKKHINLGYYQTIREAVLVRNKAAKKYFGKFAKLNKIKI